MGHLGWTTAWLLCRVVYMWNMLIGSMSFISLIGFVEFIIMVMEGTRQVINILMLGSLLIIELINCAR